ncbi:MAG: penicillin-binding protein 1A [Alphaproteobacteria bacterium]|nr:penicillin-binding protein 1A [Alphaproteobacteria bacterium]
MRFLSMLVSLGFFCCFIVFIIGFAVMIHFSVGLPDYKQLADYRPLVTSRLYANDGSLMAEYANEKRSFVPIEGIPPLVISAFMAAEDKNFYEHGGIDFMGLARAMIINVKNIGSGRRPMGASTITQQVAKNFLLTSEQSIERKIKEALLARKIEKTYTKDHILELYLNEIYLGQGSYGVASAALNYFNKDLKDLTIAQMAYLAALPKAPNNYHPVRKKEQAVARRNWVISRMVDDGYITAEEGEKAQGEELLVVEREKNALRVNGYYAEEVRRFIVDKYGEDAMYNGGLFIRTSLDPKMQAAAVKALQEGLLNYDKRHGWRGAKEKIDISLPDFKEKFLQREIPAYVPEGWMYAVVTRVKEKEAEIYLSDGKNGKILLTTLKWARKALENAKISLTPVQKVGDVLEKGDVVFVSLQNEKEGTYYLQQVPQAEGSLIALDPHTGRILAMVGGFSFYRNQFNRGIQAKRQPGSSFKPFVYLAALDSGFTPSTLILDAPIVMRMPDGSVWKPKNYSKKFYGPTTLRVGLEKSRNLMTIRLAQAIGMKKVASYARKFGITDHLQEVLSSALGAHETTLMKLTTAYGSLVNGGKKITPNLIDRIQDRDGNTIYKHDMRPCPNCVGELANPMEKPEIIDAKEQIQDPVSAYQMVHILTGVVERGTGRVAKAVRRTLGAKSGTSNDSFDAWFIGFSPDLVAGVWVGFDNPQTLGANDTGGVVAGPIFRDFMSEALKDKPDIPFRIPKGVRLVKVNPTTGKPQSEGNIIVEAFKTTDADMPSTKVIGGKDLIEEKDEAMPELGGLY